MNFQQLKYAKALAENKTFVEAANQCGVTQPTLSNGIAQLEEELGMKLFARTTRSVRLTDVGAQILPAIVDVLNSKIALTGKARELTQPGMQIIRIGVSPLVGIESVTQIVAPFRQFNPSVEIVFREMNLSDMMRLLEIGQLEFVFGPMDLKERSDLIAVQLQEEPLVFISKGSFDNQQNANKTVLLKDITDEVFVMVPDACGLAKATRSVFQRHRVKLKEYSGTAMSYRVLQEWAELGIGAAILPRSKVTKGIGLQIQLKRSGLDLAMMSYQACWNKKIIASPQTMDLGKYLTEVGPSIASGLHTPA